jgi:hypothetical protein
MPAPVYFERLDDVTFRPTIHTQGAWSLEELHFSPLGGLLVHEIRRHAASHGTPGLQLSRVSFDILGRLSLEDYEIGVRISRPGRTIELVEATASLGGRAVVVARAWRLVPVDTAGVAGGEPRALPAPDAIEPWEMASLWQGGYIASLEVRVVAKPEPGRTTAWLRSAVELLDGEHDPVASYVALIDTANGIATRRPPGEWMFPNVDLTIHLHREPGGEWVGLDTSVTFGATGLGITSTVLHDLSGAVGYANQSLTVRPL